MSNETPSDLIHGSFFFIDIIGLSNPALSTETQRTKIKILDDSIYDCKTFLSTPKEDLYILPTGDGMLIGFKDGLEQPIQLAIELQTKLKNYNEKVPDTEKISIRIGCNTGHIFVVKDVYGNVNLWGPGAILSRRVMDLGDENHILLTSTLAEDLFELSEDYKQILHPLHDYKIKHNEEILVYSAHNKNFGNPSIPKKNFENKGKSIDEKTICDKIIFNLKLQDPLTNLIKHERIFYFSNNSDEPIYSITVGIITNSTKNSEELHLKFFDEENEELKISKISLISPLTQDVTVKLNRPIFKDAVNRFVKILYETRGSERIFQNRFLNNTKTLECNFIYPKNFTALAPKLYHVDSTNEKLIEIDHKNSGGLSYTIQWKIDGGVAIEDLIRIVW